MATQADVQESVSNLTPEPRPDLNGLLVEGPGDNRIYLVDTGYKRLVLNRDLFNKDAPVTQFDVAGITTGSAVKEKAVLIHGEDDSKIYLVDLDPEPNSTTLFKRWVPSPATLVRYQFDGTKIVNLRSILTAAIPQGKDVPPEEKRPNR